jgi:hypothetical protein
MLSFAELQNRLFNIDSLEFYTDVDKQYKSWRQYLAVTYGINLWFTLPSTDEWWHITYNNILRLKLSIPDIIDK